MHLTTFSDYSIRVMMYLGLNAQSVSTISQIAHAYHISENHLTKVVHYLSQNGYVETIRGKGGGMRLAKPTSDINLGEVLRAVEGQSGLLPCVDSKGDCVILPACRLISILREAQQALFTVLDKYTLADIIKNDDMLREILM